MRVLSRGRALRHATGADRNSLARRSRVLPSPDFLSRSHARRGHILLPQYHASYCLACSVPRPPARTVRPIAVLLLWFPAALPTRALCARFFSLRLRSSSDDACLGL